ncbi:MAG TPA: hypothetical protein VF433_03870 [Cellvibrio sp.]
MPEGQFTGSRDSYVYTSDTGNLYVLQLDETLGDLAGADLDAFDPANPGTATPKPTRFSPRGVYWQATATGFEGKRKFIICGTTDATLYNSSVRQALTVDGVAGTTTGRRGEKQSFL